MSGEFKSRSVMRREALMRGEPMPTFPREEQPMGDKPSPSPGPWSWQVLGAICTLRDATGTPILAGAYYNPQRDDMPLIKRAPEMASMLRELELDDGGKCPICYRNCDGMERYIHATDCRLAALLRELP
jgi:hypothetical protein